MPRGDLYKIQHFNHGPEKTKKAINRELVDPLQDIADRVFFLEQENDTGEETGSSETFIGIVCTDGVARYAVINGILGDIVAS